MHDGGETFVDLVVEDENLDVPLCRFEQGRGAE